MPHAHLNQPLERNVTQNLQNENRHHSACTHLSMQAFKLNYFKKSETSFIYEICTLKTGVSALINKTKRTPLHNCKIVELTDCWLPLLLVRNVGMVILIEVIRHTLLHNLNP